VLMQANDQWLRRPTDLLDALANVRESESIKIRFLRGGDMKTVSITPADRGARE
jgi:S1-C subfamily serine protease